MIRLFPVTALLSFLFLHVFVTPGLCQNSVTDTAFLSRARAHAFEIYAAKIAEQSPLVNGSEYRDYFNIEALTTGHAYFLSDDWIDGSVMYDSSLYSNVPLMYDEVTDKLIVEQPFSHFKLELISEKVSYFQISGHRFERIVRAKSDSTINTGFYDVLYSGKTRAFVKRRKDISETPQVGGVIVEYLANDRYLILKDNQYHAVNHKSSVLKVFEDRKKGLRKLMRAHRSEIDFHRKREESIALISKLYDESEK